MDTKCIFYNFLVKSNTPKGLAFHFKERVHFKKKEMCICDFWSVFRDTMDHEHNEVKLQFFLHFGAASLVWFIYLPAIAFIALQVRYNFFKNSNTSIMKLLYVFK